ncbi:MATE family efflux transporter [Hungatella hathewayi]|uniref:Probable multidrug resistance protein NorM n=1 Tax=Hungatella hathewayi TaxID=154046 RepID=A0A374P8A2_9FIRM|nr:MATE family efflux transporter [Hungatella hathewayi]RGK98983.1 MATE family efflux transporter [Hungatella hathewayi]RHC53389.1 MATE family efflux transporter [Hungatella hathewayi]
MRARGKVIDMTTGSSVGCIMYFALPIILGNLFQQLYSLTDAVIVGRFVNLNALAAIGGTGWVRWAILGVCMDCTMGFGIVASRRIGAGDRTGFKEVVAAGIEFVLAAGLSLTLLSCLSLDFVLHLLHIPENIYEDARLYLWYASVSIPVGLIYNMACAFLRAAGNSKGPFAAVVLSAILNVALDLYFIVDLHWGVCGAARATLISQTAAAVLVLFLTVRQEPFRTTRNSWKWNPRILRETSALWIPMLFNSIAISAGGVIVQRYINSCGAIVAAGIDAGEKIYCLLETVEKAVCSAISVFVGQNLGAMKMVRIRKGMKSMTVFAFLFAAWLALVLLVFGDSLIGLFLNKNQDPADLKEAYRAARVYLNVQCVSIFFMVPMHFYRGAVQALGHAVYPMIAAFLQIAARWLTVALLVPALGMVGMCLPDGVAALASLPVVVIPYFVFMRRMERE